MNPSISYKTTIRRERAAREPARTLHEMNLAAHEKVARFQCLLSDLRSETAVLWEAYYDPAINLNS